MTVSGIESLSGLSNLSGLSGVSGTAAPNPTSGTGLTEGVEGIQGPQGPQFSHQLGQLMGSGVDGLEAMGDKTDALAVQAATGDLGAIHDYTIAATETSVATQLTVAVRNKAVEAFNEIMRMQV